MKRSPFRTAAALGLALSLGATAALAHPRVVSTSPAADAHVTAPRSIRIAFSEVVFPKMSGAVVRDSAGRAVATGPAATDPKDRKVLVVPITGALPPGHYTVEWHVVSADTHRVTGKYAFMVM
ncbi:MAG TPA: copper homeostasis periplasmic binding protein CopC [Caulobacteraceae bacterium]|nr:copper homeostasis periplasmic binding protein CopC [Caulobacteraceae bacterium]